ncbi:MAG: integrase [Gammaproteobacteria bacterium]
MTTIVMELYEALKKAGVDEETAKAAAKAVVTHEQTSELVTKGMLYQALLIQTFALAALRAMKLFG